MKKKNKAGRPSTYTKEIGIEICRRIAEGKTLREIMRGKDMPNCDTFYQWKLKEKGLAERYTQAREQRSDLYAEEVIGIADNVGLTNEEINKAKLKIDTRKWVACKLNRHIYGDRGITINNNTQINNNIHEQYVLEQYDVKEIEED